MLNNAEKLPEEELEDVSGGAICYIGFDPSLYCKDPYGNNVWEVVDDNTGLQLHIVSRETWDKARAAAENLARMCGRSPREISWEELQKLRGKQ